MIMIQFPRFKVLWKAILLIFMFVSLNYISIFLLKSSQTKVAVQKGGNETILRRERSLKRDQICQFVLFGNSTENVTIQEKQPILTSDVEALRITNKGCSEIVKQYSFLTASNLVTSEEQDNPIAFSILAHVNAHQVISLLSAIYRPHNAYCVHVDAKSPKAMHSALENVTKCFPNMVLATKREDVLYASISRLQADLNCMDDLLQSSIKWKYLINLCGQDFPLKTNFEIVQTLKTLKGNNLIAGYAVPKEHELSRTKYVHRIRNTTNEDGSVEKAVKRTDELKSPPPFNMTVRKNLAYNIFTRRFLQWVLYESEKAKALLEWSRDTYSPDEHYWLMLDTQAEAPGRTGRITPGAISPYIVWINSGLERCKGYYKHYNCVFGWGDVKKMLGNKSLFANKFDVTYDSLPLKCIRYYLDDKTPTLKKITKKGEYQT